MFFQNYSPKPFFSFFGINIYFYGLFLLVAILLTLFVVLKLSKNKIKKEVIYDLFFYLVIFCLIGARLFEIFFDKYFLKNPLELLKIWQGGLTIFGALIFGLLTLFFYSRKKKISFLFLSDIFAPAIALAQTIARWGNYFNQEIYGLPVSWGIFIGPKNRVADYEKFSYFHPVFFYESLLNFFLFLFLLFYFKKNKKRGNIAFIYLISYSLIRFFLEFLRIDPQPIILGLRTGQIFSLIIILGSLFLFKKLEKSRKSLNL